MNPDELPRIAHDAAILESFYTEHVEAVLRFVARRVDDPHTAADLTAEVFLAAIDSAPAYRPELGAPGAWLYGVARNVVSGEHRRAARERDATARVRGRRLLDDDDIARLQDRIDAEAPGRRLLAGMSELPDGERAVLELVAVDGLRAAEAAAVLGIRPVTARVRLHRARTTLRRLISDDESPLISHIVEAS
jgi:RNA polymerase sigma factor (sigma-70 family)